MINQTAPDTTDEVEEVLNREELGEIKRKSVSGAISFLLRTALLQGIGLVAAFVLSSFFSPEDFGIYGLVTQIIGLLVFFSDIGFAAALVQKKEEPTLVEYRTAFTIQQILSWILVAVCLGIVATGLLQQKTGPAGNWILLSLAVSFPLASLKTISSIMLERRLDFSKLIIPQIAEQLIFQSLLIFLAWNGFGAMAYAYAIVARALLGLVVMWIIQPWSVGLAINQQAVKSLMSYGAKFQLNDFLARIKDQLFFLVLGSYLPLREFGYLNWSKNWSMYPYNLTVQNVMAVTFPTFSRLQHNKQALQKAIEKSLFFITLVIFPLLMGMAVFIYPLTQVITRWGKWEPAILSFVFFTFSIGLAAISTPLTNTLNATGQINQTLKLMTLWTTLTWILTPVLMYFFGFNGIALAAALISLTSVMPIFYVQKIVPIQVWDQVWRQLLAVCVMGVVGLVGIQYWALSPVAFAVGVLLTGTTYLVSLGLVGHQKLWLEFRSLRSS